MAEPGSDPGDWAASLQADAQQSPAQLHTDGQLPPHQAGDNVQLQSPLPAQLGRSAQDGLDDGLHKHGDQQHLQQIQQQEDHQQQAEELLHQQQAVELLPQQQQLPQQDDGQQQAEELLLQQRVHNQQQVGELLQQQQQLRDDDQQQEILQQHQQQDVGQQQAGELLRHHQQLHQQDDDQQQAGEHQQQQLQVVQASQEPDLHVMAQQLAHLDHNQLGYSAPMFAQQQPQQQQGGEPLQSGQSDFLAFQMQPHHQQQHFDSGTQPVEEVGDVDIMRVPLDSQGLPIPAAQHLEQHHHMDLHDQLAELAAQQHVGEEHHEQEQQLQGGVYEQMHQQYLDEQQQLSHLEQHGEDSGLGVPQEYVALGQAKACRLCHIVRMLDQYHVNNSNADKHDTRCKACCAEYEKLKRAKKKRIHEPTVSEKKCRCCEEVKPATDFYRYTYSKDGLYQQCKACHARAGEIRLSRQGDPESKVCSKCNEEKLKADFYVSKYLSSGLHSQCKRCVRLGQEKKTRCQPEDAAACKVCRRCRLEKPAQDFFWNKMVSDGLSTYCRICSAANSRAAAVGADVAGELEIDVESMGAMVQGDAPGAVKQGGCRYNNPQPTKERKHCKKCNTTKGQEEFYHIKSSSDGLASNCKDCAVKIANMTRKHYHEEPTVDSKECKMCGDLKAAEDFYRNRTNADGLFGKCKKCSDSQAEANRKPRVRHNVSEPTVTEKECTKCQIVKPQNEFNRDKTKADGLQFRCKMCVHEYMRKRRRTDAGRRLESASAADHALAANNLAVLAQAAEPGRLQPGMAAHSAGDTAPHPAHLPPVDMHQVLGVQHVDHMDHLQAALEGHMGAGSSPAVHDTAPSLPLFLQVHQPGGGQSLPPPQPSEHQAQEQLLQGGLPHQALSAVLPGGPDDAPYPTTLHQQQEPGPHVIGHISGHMVGHVSTLLEDDPMNSITLEAPTS